MIHLVLIEHCVGHGGRELFLRLIATSMSKSIEFLYFLPMGSLNHVENGNQKKKRGSQATFFVTDS